MENAFIGYVVLFLVIIALVMVANKLRVAYPIVLVLGGLALGFAPFFPDIVINPNLVFFIFLPPLLYEAAWQVSWKGFWKFRRVIFSFAFPIVVLTSCVVAVVAHSLIPGFTLALGFLLGGIVSPPDAVSASTIMRNVKVPKSLLTVAEGESLLNDASSLIVFRFALAAVVTGQFYLQQAALSFGLVVAMGIAIGLAVALAFYAVHRWLPTTPAIETVLSLLTPYCMYYAAEHFHFSGVLAVVSGGLLLSHRRNTMLSFRSRIQGFNTWNSLVFVLNGLIFMLIGLQLPHIASQLEDGGLGNAIWYGLLVSLVLIVTRLACTLGASVFTRIMSRFIAVADPNPGWRVPVVFGGAGMRGVVSLAAALSIPVVMDNGAPFPYRNLILFITFVVILVTLVFQGLTLPWVIRMLHVEDDDATSEVPQEMLIQKKLANASLQFLEENYGNQRTQNQHLNNLFQRLQLDLNQGYQQPESDNATIDNTRNLHQGVYLEVLEQQRKLLNEMNRSDDYDEELIRKYLGLIDIEEFKIREKQLRA